MSQDTSAKDVAVSRSSVRLLMLLVGFVGATAAGVAGAATPEDVEVPALKLHYTADALDTDVGAKALYGRLVHAAEQVCPADFTGSRLVNESVLHCRSEAIARAVHQINNSHLAAVYSATTKRG